MIIGTCGFCSTGSSAVSDYLKEFDEVETFDSVEFTITYLTDGLIDLEYHLMKQNFRDDSCYSAIPRFRKFMKAHFEDGALPKLTPITKKQIRCYTDEFINSIVQINWRSTSRSDVLLDNYYLYRYFGTSIMNGRVIPMLTKKVGHPVDIYPVRDLQVSIKPTCFYESAKKLINSILAAAGVDITKKVVLDQPFCGNDPASSFPYFDDPKAIVVDRDPRDNYLFTKIVLAKRGLYMPVDNVSTFVNYYRLMRDNQPYKQSNDRILRIQFEDMVYNYENTTPLINEFCGLQGNPNPFTIFNPEISMPNTQLFRRFPEYAKDIEFIEKELPEYLFDFTKYPEPTVNGPMFYGKSPLNKRH